MQNTAHATHTGRAAKRIGLFLIAVMLAAATVWVVYIRIYYGHWPEWTGFGESPGSTPPQNIASQHAKTLWDWLQLLVVPVAIAVGVYWLNRAEGRHKLHVEESRASEEMREKALADFFKSMTEMLLKNGLLESVKGSPVRAIARSRTFSVLPRLDGVRKGVLLQFLFECGLITKGKTVIELWAGASEDGKNRGADLSRADLSNMSLPEANLHGVILRNADLSTADLWGADLGEADLSSADLGHAMLFQADLAGALLTGANLWAADIEASQLKEAAKLTGANMWDSLYEDLKREGIKGIAVRPDLRSRGSRLRHTVPRFFRKIVSGAN